MSAYALILPKRVRPGSPAQAISLAEQGLGYAEVGKGTGSACRGGQRARGLRGEHRGPPGEEAVHTRTCTTWKPLMDRLMDGFIKHFIYFSYLFLFFINFLLT